MPYKIVMTPNALKDLDNINSFDREKIIKKIEFFKSVDRINSFSKKLKDFEVGDYRLRVGNYRLIYDIDKDVIILTKIDLRKDVY